MKLTKKQLRRLIQEALDRIPILNPVTRQELDQIRAQSRSRAGIGSELQGKLQGLESPKLSDQRANEKNINQARFLAKSLGSKQGEITSEQEDDFFRAQLIHELLPLYESFFGKQRMFQFETRFLELLKKFYETSQAPGEFKVTMSNLKRQGISTGGPPQQLQESHDKILNKLAGLSTRGKFSYNRVSYVISEIGPAGGGGLVGADSNAVGFHEWAQLQRFVADECNNHGLNPPLMGYHIYKMALTFRPDLKTYVHV
mgnify:CR=1 FL=1